MQAAHFYKKNRKRRSHFPMIHSLLATFIASVTTIAYLAIPNTTEASPNPIHIPIELSFEPLNKDLYAVENKRTFENSKTSLPDEPNWEAITLKDSDKLRTVFRQARIPNSEYKKLHKQHGEVFDELGKNQRLVFQFGENREINTLRYTKSPLKSYTFKRNSSGFSRKTHLREPQIRYQNHSITMHGSLNNSLKKAQVFSGTIQKQIQTAFRGHINLTKHARQGDEIHLLVEEQYIDGQKLGYGNVLAAQFEGHKRDYTAYRYKSRDGSTDYYSPKVKQKFKTIRKPTRDYFLSNPVPGSRVSSNFSHKRLHPVLKTYRPHRGTDYAARTGTPILATANGRVVTAGRGKANGNYIVIKHGNKYTTKYLHLHRKYVKSGDYVKRGQTIGSVGATGLARGAHLHYEFLVNGVHKNPRHVSRYTPKAYTNVEVPVETPGAIPGDERKRFFNQTRGVRLQFAAANRSKSESIAATPKKKTEKPKKETAQRKPVHRETQEAKAIKLAHNQSASIKTNKL